MFKTFIAILLLGTVPLTAFAEDFKTLMTKGTAKFEQGMTGEENPREEFLEAISLLDSALALSQKNETPSSEVSKNDVIQIHAMLAKSQLLLSNFTENAKDRLQSSIRHARQALDLDDTLEVTKRLNAKDRANLVATRGYASLDLSVERPQDQVWFLTQGIADLKRARTITGSDGEFVAPWIGNANPLSWNQDGGYYCDIRLQEAHFRFASLGANPEENYEESSDIVDDALVDLTEDDFVRYNPYSRARCLYYKQLAEERILKLSQPLPQSALPLPSSLPQSAKDYKIRLAEWDRTEIITFAQLEEENKHLRDSYHSIASKCISFSCKAQHIEDQNLDLRAKIGTLEECLAKKETRDQDLTALVKKQQAVIEMLYAELNQKPNQNETKAEKPDVEMKQVPSLVKKAALPPVKKVTLKKPTLPPIVESRLPLMSKTNIKRED